MVQKSAAQRKNARRVTLHIGASFDAAWKNVLLPWFQTAAGVSWRQQKPTLVVVPFRSHAYAIKGLLLDRGVSLLGIRFVSPPELRETLSSKSEMRLPLREHLRLLLSIAAEECMELPEDPALREKRMLEADFLAAKSVARAPDHLLRTIDQLGAAGWDFAAVELPALREVEARFQKHVARCGFELIHIADRRAAANASKPTRFLRTFLSLGLTARTGRCGSCFAPEFPRQNKPPCCSMIRVTKRANLMRLGWARGKNLLAKRDRYRQR
jgi:hypothetical protein